MWQAMLVRCVLVLVLVSDIVVEGQVLSDSQRSNINKALLKLEKILNQLKSTYPDKFADSTGKQTSKGENGPVKPTVTELCYGSECLTKDNKCPSNLAAKQLGTFTFNLKKKACGKYYYVSLMKETFVNYLSGCCRLSMEPLIFETREEFDCIIKFLRETQKMSEQYWTGGTLCSQNGGFAWCSSGQMIDSSAVVWLYEPKLSASENCVALQILAGRNDKSGLITVSCKDRLKQVGESDVP